MSDAIVAWLVLGLFVFIVLGMLGGWVAEQKGRNGGEGFLLGLLFGPLGVLIEALLPSQLQHEGGYEDEDEDDDDA